MNHSVIIADNDASVLSALKMLLELHNFSVTCVTTPAALIEQVSSTMFSVAIVDLNYQSDTTSGAEGLELIEKIVKIDSHLPIVVMTGYSSVEIAVATMKVGARDFIEKPWNNERLLSIIHTQIEKAQLIAKGEKLQEENALLKAEQASTFTSSNLVAESSAMRNVVSQLQMLAKSDMSILLTGENGTGKSALAKYIHEQSARFDNPFIGVNMGAITDNLFESEMFGHVKGAFTDAKQQRIGRFELAGHGTIFLDEIANIQLPQQAKLLRVLEERQFEKVGSSRTQSLDSRIISATNADIQSMVANGEFRQDLLYRLNTIVVQIPALRERREDIPFLASLFLKVFAKKYQQSEKSLTDDALKLLVEFDWPGNIRELQHTLERAYFLSADVIDIDAFPMLQSSAKASSTSELQNNQFPIDWRCASLEDIEKAIIQERYIAFQQNPVDTAKSLGLSRSAYYRRLEKFNLG